MEGLEIIYYGRGDDGYWYVWAGRLNESFNFSKIQNVPEIPHYVHKDDAVLAAHDGAGVLVKQYYFDPSLAKHNTIEAMPSIVRYNEQIEKALLTLGSELIAMIRAISVENYQQWIYCKDHLFRIEALYRRGIVDLLEPVLMDMDRYYCEVLARYKITSD